MEKSNTNKTSFINMPALLSAYRANWVWVIVSVFIFLCMGFLVYKTSIARTEVVAQVLVSDESSTTSQMSELAGLFSGSSFGKNRSIEDEMVIVKAHSLLRQTVVQLDMNVTYTVRKNLIKKVDVYQNPPVRLVYDRDIADTLGIPLKFELKVNAEGKANLKMRGYKNRVVADLKNTTLPVTVNTAYGNFTLVEGSTYAKGKELDETILLVGYDGAALMLDKLIAVDFSAKKTDIMFLSYVTSDAAWGKQVVNALVSNYNELTIAQKQAFNQKTLDFLNERIRILSAEVDSTQNEVQSFLSHKDLVNPGAQAGYMLTQTNKQEFDLIQSETEYNLLTMAIEFLSNEANNTSMLPIMPSTTSLTGLIEGYNSLILSRLELEASAKGDNLALKAINDRIVAVRDNLLTALNKQSETAAYQINELRRQYNKSKGKLTMMPELEREYANITRESLLKEQLFTYLLNKREETEMTIAGAHPRGVVIDEAYVTDAVIGLSPKVAMGSFLLLGLLLPALCIVLKWVLTRRVVIADQAVDLSGGRSVIAEIIGMNNTDAIVSSDPSSASAGRFRLFRNNLLGLKEDSNQVVGIIPTFEEGLISPCVAVNLAISMAMSGRKTVIVDADVFGSPVKQIMDVKNAPTLQNDVESGTTGVAKLDLGYGNQTIDVVVADMDGEYGGDFLSSIKFGEYIDGLKKEYDYVIVNMPFVGTHYGSVESVCRVSDIMIGVVKLHVSEKCSVARLSTLESRDTDESFIAIVE